MNYYIQGDAANADKIKAAFEKLGYEPYCWTFETEFYFTVDCTKTVQIVSSSSKLINIIKTHPDYKELELPIEPKFKVGDEIKTGNTIETIAEVDHAARRYYCESGRTISFVNQDLWKLDTKPHYDIANFKPFDKVLCRNCNNDRWRADYFSHLSKNGKSFIAIGYTWCQCIPFEGNEKLLGTTDMPDEMYINW
jgi:hypothetical protein